MMYFKFLLFSLLCASCSVSHRVDGYGTTRIVITDTTVLHHSGAMSYPK